MPPYRSRGLTVCQQDWALRLSPITFGGGGVKRGYLAWQLSVQPSVMSRTYGVKLEYDAWDVPRVFVLSPDLVELANGRRIPHVYSERPIQLCLYLPGGGEWHRGMSLATTIVPWAYLWFYYFEDWLVSDAWKGGGVHPTAPPAKAH